MILNLSYKLGEKTPVIGPLAPPVIERLSAIERGSPCNSFRFCTANHVGTHVDAPFHFNPVGRKISDYAAHELVFDKPDILSIELQPSQLIEPAHLAGLKSVRNGCNLIFIKSGFGRYRLTNPQIYGDENPGFSRAAAEFMLDRLPELKALAVDFISVSACKHLAEGFEAHRVFLGCKGYSNREVLLVEDTYIALDLEVPDRVFIVPWFCEGLDSAPCTVLAEYV